MKAFIYDLETTSAEVKKAHIVQLAYVVLDLKSGEHLQKDSMLINPPVHISEEATKIHGITDEDVKNAPRFEEVVNDVIGFISGVDIIGGYNNYNYDDLVLELEVGRVNHAIDLSKHLNLDLYKVVRHYFDMSVKLTGLYRFITGTDLDDAHDAMNDVLATIECLNPVMSRVDTYRISKGLPLYSDDLNHIQDMFEDELDRGGLLQWEEDEVILSFGKYKGVSLRKVEKQDRGYLQWMCNQETFAEDFKAILIKAMQGVFPKPLEG